MQNVNPDDHRPLPSMWSIYSLFCLQLLSLEEAMISLKIYTKVISSGSARVQGKEWMGYLDNLRAFSIQTDLVIQDKMECQTMAR